MLRRFSTFTPKLPKSKYFNCENLSFADGRTEQIYKGGRSNFPQVAQVFKDAGIKNIGVIGWGSQAAAQSMNLRDTLNGHGDFHFKVGLRPGSKSSEDAKSKGFSVHSMMETVHDSDLTLMLISDAAQVELYPKFMDVIRPRTTLGFSHGFLSKYWDKVGYIPKPDLNIIGVCPKGMGPSVRRLYELGQETEGAGINSSVAVQQDITGKSFDIALAWATGIGSPSIFTTTLEDEATSDIFGERGILLGGLHGLIEALFIRSIVRKDHYSGYYESAHYFTGELSKFISKNGLPAFYESLEEESHKMHFRYAYDKTYRLCKPLMEEIYDEVKTGNEIMSVINRTANLEKNPLDKVSGNSPFWTCSRKCNAMPLKMSDNASFNAGVYIGTMMSQIDTLLENGHSNTEIINESVTEAVDSLNPYMFNDSVDTMIDNCSITARIGARKWAPRFQHTLINNLVYDRDIGELEDSNLFDKFLTHPIHDSDNKLRKFKPSVSLFPEE